MQVGIALKLLTLTMLFFVLSKFACAQTTVLVAYDSKTGNTRTMAQAVAEGASLIEGVTVMLKPVEDVVTEDLLLAAAIIVGSPVYNGNVTPKVQAFITSWPFENRPLKDKIGAAFVTAGGISAGEELTQMNILQSMLIFGMVVVGGPDWTSPFGASAIIGESPFHDESSIHNQFIVKARNLGERVAGLAKKM